MIIRLRASKETQRVLLKFEDQIRKILKYNSFIFYSGEVEKGIHFLCSGLGCKEIFQNVINPSFIINLQIIR